MKKLILHDGNKIEINIFGKKHKFLLLLAGWTHDFQYETKFINELSKKYTVLTISYPGYSQSEENPKAQSMTFLSTIIDSVIHSQNITKFTLVGFSMGCQVVVNYLSSHPQQHAVLISPILHSLLHDSPLYARILLASPFLLNIVRHFSAIKKTLVLKAYSQIGKVTEGAENTSQFTDGRVSITGAFDTLIATLTTFNDPVRYQDRIRFIFGDGEIMQARLDQLNIPYSIISESGHGAFDDSYNEIARLISA